MVAIRLNELYECGSTELWSHANVATLSCFTAFAMDRVVFVAASRFIINWILPATSLAKSCSLGGLCYLV